MIVSQIKTIKAISKTKQSTENENFHLTSILSSDLLYEGYVYTVMMWISGSVQRKLSGQFAWWLTNGIW